MKKIKIEKDIYTLVSDSDYDEISSHKLIAYLDRQKNLRAHIYINRHVAIPLSIYIMCPPNGFLVDHENGNTLDNQRSNLRICTQAENSRNSKRPSNNTSGIKGVGRTKNNKWTAQIRRDGVFYHGGTFDCPLLAANKYREMTKRYHGEFANFG